MHNTQNKKICEKRGQLRKNFHLFCDENILNNVSITEIFRVMVFFYKKCETWEENVVLHLLRENMSRRMIEAQFIHFEHMNTFTTHMIILYKTSNYMYL